MTVMERRLTIPAALQELASACDFVAEAAREAGLDEESVYRCHLSVEEVCTNVIEHGYRFTKGDKVIDIECRVYPDRFTVTIIDDAPPFNPLSQPEPNPTAPLWERESGGWGIYFVRQYMDSVAYEYRSNRNHFMMSKNF